MCELHWSIQSRSISVSAQFRAAVAPENRQVLHGTMRFSPYRDENAPRSARSVPSTPSRLGQVLPKPLIDGDDEFYFSDVYDSEEEEFPVNDAPKTPAVAKKSAPVTPAPAIAKKTPMVQKKVDEAAVTSTPAASAAPAAEGRSDSEDEHAIPDLGEHLSPYHPHNKASVLSALQQKSQEVSRTLSLVTQWSHHATKAHADTVKRELADATKMMTSLELEAKESVEQTQGELERRNKEMLDRIEFAIANAKRYEAEEKARREREEVERQRKAKEEADRATKARLEAEKKKQEEEAKKKEEENRKLAEMAQKQAADAEAAKLERARQEQEAKMKEQEKKLKAFEPADVSVEADAHLAVIERLKVEVLKPVSETKEWKTFCFKAKRQITPKLGQLTKSRKKILAVIGAIENVFFEAEGVSEIVYLWLLNFFSKSVVKQAETEVAVAPATAYPLAYVCAHMLSKHPKLLPLFMARFAKNCPFVVPVWRTGRTEGDMKLNGIKRFEDGKWEDESPYTERMCGIFATYIATTQTELWNNQPNLLPFSASWKWMARLLNKPPQSSASPAIYSMFMDIAGEKFVRVYGKQGDKMIRLAVGGWVEAGKGIEGPAMRSSSVRLQIMGEEYIKTGKLKEFEGNFDN
ncbi:hypothetical protein G7K_0788-t1 [Saitoella complicata NRRL Y-17804]|uniref:mRNA export factor GLE1 n=1 Tax=Saitoella complicata (strain BCRC 22490 / CBS 7301 / JCM 7358 / NBRC 10748 / NRRL Y-17804) TaxID=698492 RepID=A0A0E9N9T8_SAICN|nr:hypothetical protein G7K_0788-t1 [Saitoella complicata NRRL Y-17804]